MNRRIGRLTVGACAAAVALMVSGCIPGPPGYDFGGDYYAPYGGGYGGFDDGYFVGPYSDFDHPYGGGGGRGWHGVAGARGVPSIPGGFRGGGGGSHGGGGGFHGGGGGGGGGHGR